MMLLPYIDTNTITALDILRDLDITTDQHDIIDTIIKNSDDCDAYKQISSASVNHVVAIFDKFTMCHITRKILNTHIVPPTKATVSTIHHTFTDGELIELYARTDAYNLVYNYNNTFCATWIVSKAVRNGLCIQNMTISSPTMNATDVDIDACNANLTKLTITHRDWGGFSGPIGFMVWTYAILPYLTTITDSALRNCIAIESLDATDNPNITTCVPFAATLHTLVATYTCGIGDAGLSSCTHIKILNADDNPKITTCDPFANSLRELIAEYRCGISDVGLSSCTQLNVLCAFGNVAITTCAPFAKLLRKLRIGGECGIRDEGVSQCTAIEELNVSFGYHITTCTPFAKSLTILHANGEKCTMDDIGISMCTSITTLSAYNNPRITTCAPFAKTLTTLDASYTCGISDAGLISCHNLKKLNVFQNQKITTCAPFTKSLEYIMIKYQGYSKYNGFMYI